nr:MAG TPA: hypothetical protein [Caudoviricetes sp.]
MTYNAHNVIVDTSDKERTPKGRRKRGAKMRIEGIGVISKNKLLSIGFSHF